VTAASNDVTKKLKATASLTEKGVEALIKSSLTNMTAKLDALEARMQEGQERGEANLGPVKDSLEAIKGQLQEQAKVAGRDQEALKAVLGGLGTVLGSVDAKLDGVVLGISQLSERLDMGLAGLLSEIRAGNTEVKARCDQLATVVGELQARASGEVLGVEERLGVLEAGQRQVLTALEQLKAASPEASRQRLDDPSPGWSKGELAGLTGKGLIWHRLRGAALTGLTRTVDCGRWPAGSKRPRRPRRRVMTARWPPCWQRYRQGKQPQPDCCGWPC
jgi:hypothetical protein